MYESLPVALMSGMYECFLAALVLGIMGAHIVLPLCNSCEKRTQEYAIFIMGSLIALPILVHALSQIDHDLSYHLMLRLYYAYAILVLGVFSRVWYRPANFGRLLLTWSISPILLVLAICGLGKDA